ncbi:MAG: ArsA family ATPase [Brevinematia bacterium]
MRVYFFTGKGGTGKTTISAATGAGISGRGFKTLLVSLDPAHNLGDVLKIKIGDRVVKVEKNFFATEINIEKTIKKYLSSLREKMKTLFKYLSVLNLEKYFDIIKISPGMEEYSILEIIKDFIREKKYEIILFDMPPTGITLRIFGMPELSILWAERLIELRKNIISRKQMIENVEGFNFSNENEDPVMQELLNYKREMEELKSFFSSENCSVNIVTTPEKIALFETERIFSLLTKLKIKIDTIYINKIIRLKNIPFELEEKIREQEEVISAIKDKSGRIKELPLIRESLTGMEKLKDFYENYLRQGKNEHIG